MTSAELTEILRLNGVPIPRFESVETEDAWFDSPEGKAVLDRAAVEGSNGKLPFRADGSA
jgi:hypothetical protein